VKTLLRETKGPCTVPANEPAAKAGRDRGALTDQGIDDPFLIIESILQRCRQDDALWIGFEQQDVLVVQVAGISRARRNRELFVITETEVDEALGFRGSPTLNRLVIEGVAPLQESLGQLEIQEG